MHAFIVRVGKRTLNLQYLIVAEELGDQPGTLRLMMEQGMFYDFAGPDADKLRGRLDALDKGDDTSPQTSEEDITDQLRGRPLSVSSATNPKRKRGSA